MSGHAVGVRIPYAHAPAHVHRWVESRLGGDVVDVVDCVGGMSPGPAARVRTASGEAAFVKGCGVGLHPDTPSLLRDEARVLAALPEHPSLPRLLDCHDDGDWVVLLIEDLPGAPPPAPWRSADLRRFAEALATVRPALDALHVEGLPAARESSPIFLTRWRELAARLDLVDPWWTVHHDVLAGHAERAADLIAGDAVVHWDIRADNVLLTPDRTVLVDWGQARRSAAWMDHALLALDCSMTGSEISTAEQAAADRVLRDRDPADLLALASAVAMAFVSRSTQPASPGLPTMPATCARWAAGLRPYLAEALLRAG
ncbi:phosphotransferase family protein [Humibacillus xanthopallidus]|uniref:Phosphotransferase family enzyme n=1 Tax=Humibacillus xanthopallidus TaxID=412689 RepID=A0A543H858_9MICO|nr:phosphotransferase [Humibacillus xanthopallidus]TQM54537.1 phosphotransferase family enzyme [Humibacillus xanthopallidus]